MDGFPGFSPEAVKFLRSLKRNNDREWFQPRKEIYERLWRAPMIALVTALQEDMESFAPAYVQEPAKAVMRIYRDTRFSKNKTPYKTHVSAALRRKDVSKDGGALFYMHAEESGVLVAAGVYGPSPEELRTLREHMTLHHTEFRKLMNAPAFRESMGELQGEQLTRPPKGFLPDHPAADLHRRKQFYFSVTLPAEIMTSSDLQSELTRRLKAAVPLMDFLNRPLLGLGKKNDARFLRDTA